MSYDLMVFAPDAAPKDRDAFMAWYRNITEWAEGHDYNDPKNTSPLLADWYRDMIADFPAMNGPDAISDDDAAFDSDRVTGYTCARSAIYADFRWSAAKQAYDSTLMYAAVHRVGFFDVSASDGAVWLPNGSHYTVVHGGSDNDRKVEEALAKWLASRT